MAPELKERGLIFTGIDVIGDYLTEINVTSPTGIQEVHRFGGADIAKPGLGRDRETGGWVRARFEGFNLSRLSSLRKQGPSSERLRASK